MSHTYQRLEDPEILLTLRLCDRSLLLGHHVVVLRPILAAQQQVHVLPTQYATKGSHLFGVAGPVSSRQWIRRFLHGGRPLLQEVLVYVHVVLEVDN